MKKKKSSKTVKLLDLASSHDDMQVDKTEKKAEEADKGLSSLKLIHMKRTWEFTRAWSMSMKLLETLFYIIISNTDNFIYAAGIFSMYQNAGLFGLVYPFSMFGYAMLEETRPRNSYWNFILKYTVGLLLVKFIINLQIMGNLLNNPSFVRINGYMKIGIYDHQDMKKIIIYMLPEILLIALCSMNEIKLRLMGMYYNIEEDLESVEDAIQRNILKGDEEAVKHQKLVRSNMIMYFFFRPAKD